MHIDTHSYDTMLKGACDYFEVTPCSLSNFFIITAHKCIKDKSCDGDILDDEIDTFIQHHMSDQDVDKILFFHLGRRLNDNDEVIGNNLFDLLTTETPVSTFLKEHDVDFFENNGHLEIYEKRIHISLEDTHEKGVCYLRSRLGYNIGRKDFCFNGFAFKDLLYKNNYTKSLYRGPEFIQTLSTFLKRPDIYHDYLIKSTYYCFKYCVPLELVLFDKNDKLCQNKKSTYFLKQLLKRLFKYHNDSESKYMFDHDNSILRLPDNANMSKQHYCGKEVITSEMLR